MARKLDEIQNQMLETVAADPTLSARLTSTSRVAVWRLIVYVVAFAIWLHEQIVELNAENSRPHTKRWYREQALAFMDGHPLIWKDGSFKYDTTGMTTQQIMDAQPVSHVAIDETANGILVVKTATNGINGTEPLPMAVHGRFTSYMGQIKDAGNRLEYINQQPDDLQLKLTVWVDDMAIDIATGERLDTPGTFPVEDACRGYLDSLEFNGAFIKTFLVDALQKVDGVKIPKVKFLNHRVLANPFEDVEEYVLPFSGHFTYNLLLIEYKKYNEVA